MSDTVEIAGDLLTMRHLRAHYAPDHDLSYIPFKCRFVLSFGANRKRSGLLIGNAINFITLLLAPINAITVLIERSCLLPLS